MKKILSPIDTNFRKSLRREFTSFLQIYSRSYTLISISTWNHQDTNAARQYQRQLKK